MTTITRAFREARRIATPGPWRALDNRDEEGGLIHRVLDDVRSVDRELESSVSPYPQALALPILHLRLTRTCLVHICVESYFRQEEGLPILTTPTLENLAGRLSLLFQSLLINLINNLIALQATLSRGLDFPSRTLARSQIEIATLLLALLGNAEFRDQYLAWVHDYSDQGASRHWSSLRPKKARAAVREYLAQNLSLSPSDRDSVISIFEHAYSWLSSFEHGHVVAMLASAHTVEGPALGGGHFEGCQAIAQKLVEHHYVLILMLFHVLDAEHKWTPRKHDPEGTRRMISSLKLQTGLSQHLLLGR